MRMISSWGLAATAFRVGPAYVGGGLGAPGDSVRITTHLVASDVVDHRGGNVQLLAGDGFGGASEWPQ
jgi:hypothetical protein